MNQIRSRFRGGFVSLLLMAVGMLVFAQNAMALDPINTTFFGNVAIDGYDPVAYFLERKPVEGSDDYEYEWMGATWRFASEKNLEIFKSKPEYYAPQYGGYCAYAISQNTTADIDPVAWRIVRNKLYLNVTLHIQKIWEEDIRGYITKADANWPGLLAE